MSAEDSRRQPSIADPNRQHLNKTVTVTVSAPSLTEIDVELVRLGGAANAKLTAVDPNLPGKPGEVAASKEVGVVSQDSGNGKTWNIDVNISGCADYREIQIFNRSNNAQQSGEPETERIYGFQRVQLERRPGGLRVHGAGVDEGADLHDSTGGEPRGVRRPTVIGGRSGSLCDREDR